MALDGWSSSNYVSSPVTGITSDTVGTIHYYTYRDASYSNYAIDIGDSGSNNNHLLVGNKLRLKTTSDQLSAELPVTTGNTWVSVVACVSGSDIEGASAGDRNAVFFDNAHQTLTYNTGSSTTQIWLSALSGVDMMALGVTLSAATSAWGAGPLCRFAYWSEVLSSAERESLKPGNNASPATIRPHALKYYCEGVNRENPGAISVGGAFSETGTLTNIDHPSVALRTSGWFPSITGGSPPASDPEASLIGGKLLGGGLLIKGALVA